MLKLRSKKELLELATVLKAKDLTNSSWDEQELFVNGFTTDEFFIEGTYRMPTFVHSVTPIACSIGVYGVNSLLVKNRKGEFGYISKRNNLLIQLL